MYPTSESSSASSHTAGKLCSIFQHTHTNRRTHTHRSALMKTRIPLEGQGDVSAGVMSHQMARYRHRHMHESCIGVNRQDTAPS